MGGKLGDNGETTWYVSDQDSPGIQGVTDE